MAMRSLLLWCLIAGAQTATLAADDARPVVLSSSEKDLIERTNAERKKDDKPPLKSSDVLMKVARAHAANMAKQKTMSHELDGKSPADRVKDAGYEFWQMSENIAQGPKANKEVIKGWMDSKGHHDNILSDLPTEIGVARAKAADGTVYWVQVFGRPKSEPPPKLPPVETEHEGHEK
jgi:uncharacterized protein YkwD